MQALFNYQLSIINYQLSIISIVLRLDLEVALRMVAGGANLGRLLADDDVAAVGALPDDVALA